MRCSFPACCRDSSRNPSPGVSFHRVPDEESLRAAWMEALGQTDWTPEPGSVVCSEHILLKDLLGTSTEHPLKLCRICFTTDCKMYSMTSFKTLNEAYETLTGVLTAEEEHLPRYLCGQCAGRLMNCARFRRRSLRAHSMLIDIVRRHGQITEDLIRSELQNNIPFSLHSADNLNDEYLEFDNEDLDDVNKQTEARVDESPEDVKFTVDQNHIYGEDGTTDVAINAFLKIEEDVGVSSSHSEVFVCDGIIENTDNNINVTIKIEKSDDIDKYSSSDEQTASHMESTGEDVRTQLEGLGAKTRGVVNEVKIEEQQTPEADGPSTDDMLRCDICHYQTDCNDLLLEHLKVHEAIKNVFIQNRNLQINQFINSKEKRYSCDVCNNAFRHKCNLKAHQLIHSDEKPYSCDVCNKEFRQKGTLKKHILTHSNEKPYSCNVCNKEFRESKILQNHLIMHSSEKPYSCDICFKMFSNKRYLIKHQLIHTDMKPYSCDVCQKVFRHKCNLITHRLMHSDERPYSCDVCNKGFRKKSHLQTHQLMHSNEKQFSCDVCNKLFNRRDHLKRHQLTHSNEKQFACYACNKVFREEGYLKKHVLIHTNDRQFSCDICHKMFYRRETLKRHQRTHCNEQCS